MKGFLLLGESCFYEICLILVVENRFYFITKKCVGQEFISFANGIKIETIEDHFVIIDFQRLKHKKPYERVSVESVSFIRLETLEIRNMLQLHIS